MIGDNVNNQHVISTNKTNMSSVTYSHPELIEPKSHNRNYNIISTSFNLQLIDKL